MDGCKWKRKKYLAPGPSTTEQEQHSPLALALLEEFANGASAPWPDLLLFLWYFLFLVVVCFGCVF